jgi:cellobiose phosphorylase
VLTVHPCVPRGWPGFTIDYRFGASAYRITVEQVDATTDDAADVTLDGRRVENGEVHLVDDGSTHQVHVRVRRTT